MILLAIADTTRQIGMEMALRETIGELEKQMAELKSPPPDCTGVEDTEKSV